MIELKLKSPITIGGETINKLKIRRMQKSDVFSIAHDNLGEGEAITRFAARCAVGHSNNGDVSLSQDDVKSLSLDDGLQFQSILAHMVTRTDDNYISEGDGIDHPIIYTLVNPIKSLGKTVEKLSFKARKFGDFVEIEDIEDPESSFDEFLRRFSSTVDVELAISDSFVKQLDCRDIFAIKGEVMGKLADTSPRWKEV